MSREILQWQLVAMSHHLDLIHQAERLRPVPPDDPDTALARLTHREWEVLCLIVARNTDREIADRLFISYRTVTSHVTNIFNKLGVSSRRDAAAMVTQGIAA